MAAPPNVAYGPPSDFLEYTSFAADPDLVAAGSTGFGARLIQIVDAGSGSLVLTTGDGNNRTASGLVNGDELYGWFSAIITTGTNVTKIRVYW